MDKALELMTRILSDSDPGDTIYLPIHQAELIALLPAREIGALWYAIAKRGVIEAFRREGLFSRNIIVVEDQRDCYAVVSAREPVPT